MDNVQRVNNCINIPVEVPSAQHSLQLLRYIHLICFATCFGLTDHHQDSSTFTVSVTAVPTHWPVFTMGISVLLIIWFRDITVLFCNIRQLVEIKMQFYYQILTPNAVCVNRFWFCKLLSSYVTLYYFSGVCWLCVGCWNSYLQGVIQKAIMDVSLNVVYKPVEC